MMAGHPGKVGDFHLDEWGTTSMNELHGTYGHLTMVVVEDGDVDPPFCPPSTCPIRYLFNTLQQFHGDPLLLV